MAAGQTEDLLFRIEDSASSDDTLSDATSELQRELAKLDDVDGVRPKPKSSPANAKPVGSILLGALLVKVIASGSALTGVISVARSWIKARGSRSVTLQFGKDKLVIKGASTSEQEKAVSEWISRHANKSNAPLAKDSAKAPARERAPEKSKSRVAIKKAAAQKKSARHSS